QEDGEDQWSDTGASMDRRSTGEVECTKVGEPASAPEPVSHRRIDDKRPQSGEQDQRTELHALRKRAGNEGWCDRRKHHLENHKGLMWNRRPVGRMGY